ncbi:hypothetical protein ACU4GD_14220 [Cupriavidus basilensis]
MLGGQLSPKLYQLFFEARHRFQPEFGLRQHTAYDSGILALALGILGQSFDLGGLTSGFASKRGLALRGDLEQLLCERVSFCLQRFAVGAAHGELVHRLGQRCLRFGGSLLRRLWKAQNPAQKAAAYLAPASLRALGFWWPCQIVQCR